MFLALSLLALTPSALPPFELKDDDRVVWIGNTLVEREQKYGFWETALLSKFAKQNVTVRNLGWSGDTVFGDARAGFDSPKQGYERLVSLALESKPTVIFVSYGTNESFEGPAGVAKFQKGLEKLLDALAPSKARVVLFSPLPFEKAKSLPDPTERNKVLQLYAQAVREVADSRGHRYADLFNLALAHETTEAGSHFTDNGMHLTEAGYEATIPNFMTSLGLSWAGEDPKKFDAARATIRRKNQLFFYRWRPQNETYLLGFRKHEQGKNAKEIVQFDPLVDHAEQELRAILTK
ncbi:SGNH/GDSL hydrolase family protein [Limnoglobus roseus]|uniref:Nodulin-26 n=1 Tax=Limnoglobus roseus TaxID=2598579 RepID=A0A5C1AHX5_9BACT|nr:SGNH/GDSL hydrolase family protein [Limnoglobus roseus]QEL18791.1 nodulin-26 [Limnoglobus roseus]